MLGMAKIEAKGDEVEEVEDPTIPSIRP